MKALKITNPLWLGQIGPKIDSFVKKINVAGITYESLYSYFAQSIQHGGEMSEFWCVFDEEQRQPVAFAHWLVRGLPHIGKVYCDFVYSWTKQREPASLLIDKFIDFGKKHRSPIYEGDAINEITFRLFRKTAHDKGYGLEKSGHVNFVGRKRNENI
jgi:hypothetical protein